MKRPSYGGTRCTVPPYELEHGKMDEAQIYQAEGWAYFRVIEPLVADVNPADARTVAGIFDLKAKPAKGSGKRVGGALAKTYDGLGVRAAEVGVRMGSGLL